MNLLYLLSTCKPPCGATTDCNPKRDSLSGRNNDIYATATEFTKSVCTQSEVELMKEAELCAINIWMETATGFDANPDEYLLIDTKEEEVLQNDSSITSFFTLNEMNSDKEETALLSPQLSSDTICSSGTYKSESQNTTTHIKTLYESKSCPKMIAISPIYAEYLSSNDPTISSLSPLAIRGHSFDYLESKQNAFRFPLSPRMKNLTFSDTNNTPKLQSINEDNGTCAHHTNDNEISKSLDHINIEPPDLNGIHICSKSVDNVESLSLGLQRRASTPPISLPSQLPQHSSFAKSNSANNILPVTPTPLQHPSFKRANSDPISLNASMFMTCTRKPLKSFHIASKSAELTNRKPTKVFTKENINDWSMDRLVSEKNEMKKQLLFLERYNSEKEGIKSNTFWIDTNDDI